MAATRKGLIVTMTAANDTIEGKFRVRKVVSSCGAAPFEVRLATGAALDEVWLRARGIQNATINVDFDPPLPIEDIKLLAKGGDPVLIYLA